MCTGWAYWPVAVAMRLWVGVMEDQMAVGGYSVALVGFSEKESATFESFFRLAARRPPAYAVQAEVIDAHVLIVNADNAQALHLVRYAQLPGKVLLIGRSDHGMGWPLQRKPVKLVGVLAAMDELMGHRRPARAPAEGLEVPAAPRRKRSSGDSEFPSTRPMRRQAEVPAASAPPKAARTGAAQAPAPASSGVVGVTDFGALEPQPVAQVSADARDPARRASQALPLERGDVLLVAESLVEGRILHKRLRRYDFSVDWSREAAQALALLEEHPYKLVVIDRLSGDPDAYTVCRRAKQCKTDSGLPPVVVMFAPAAGSKDRIKAGLAGCDAYLSRSIGEAELYRVLAQQRLLDVNGFEQTNLMSF